MERREGKRIKSIKKIKRLKRLKQLYRGIDKYMDSGILVYINT